MADPEEVVDRDSEVDKTEASDTEKQMIEHTHTKPQAEDDIETDHNSTAEASVLLKARTDASQSNEDGLQKEQEPAPEARGQEPEQEPAPEARGQEPEQEPAPEPHGQEPEQEPAPEPHGQEPEQEPAPEARGQEPEQEPAPEARGQEPEQEPAPEPHGQEPEQEPAPEARGQEPEQEPAPEARGQEPEQEPAPEPHGQEPEQEPAPEARGQEPEQEPAPEPHGQEPEQEPAPEPHGQELEQEPAPEARGQEPEQEPAPEAHGQEPEQEPAPEAHGQEPEQEPAPEPHGQEPALEEQEQKSIEGQEPALEQENDLAVGNQEELLEKGEQGVSEPTAPLTEITEEISQITTETFAKLLAAEIYNLGTMQLEALESERSLPEVMTNATATGRLIEDNETLMDIGVRPHGTIQIEMFSLDPEQYPIKAIKLQQDYNMPDVITVRVQTDSDTFQDVAVEIERPTYRKPFLGGFKHRVTGVEFHNAGSQTVPKKRRDKGIKVFCRETQTVVEKNKRQQTRNTTSTQMTKIGLYVSNMTDKLIEPRTYLTAEEYHKQRLDAIIVLQKYFRRWHAINVVQKLREEKRLRLEWEAQEELRKKREKEERLRREHERRLNPKTKEDFELLYHALELWRQEEIERINNTLTGAERKAALCALLEQETQLIASIGRHKLNADEENQQKAILFFLDKCAEPKKWKAYDGKITEMDTQFTLRARELLEIYRSISMKDLPKDERLDVLLTLKHTVKEHECKLTHEIVELIDREADLMMRGVKECNLEGLRKRICTLFLQYIKTPIFNPEVARVLKVPPDPLKLYQNIYFCRGCKSYLPSTEFSVPANSRTVGRCRRCCKLDNEARRREAFLKYKLMLKNLRKSEADYQDDAKIVYVVQQKDLQYMVENIWGCQSALSAWDDLHDLVTVRWDKHCEWSPWNTVLLTKDEAKAHLKLHNLQEAYEMVFIHRIKHKHILAKNYFSQIPEMASFLHKGDDQAHTNELLITKPIPAGSKA
ncbi:IQ and ubiquitin-like domain-containing protein isoform X2 [Trachemys scripta elegans]|uniref:IQ and ubiquitin-like domain-containing protein isoform X2 n=1 Tax=Trachemys scripta elegans TaxID=31138 RepID=UPI00155669E3|nr:IQ and ubiquitin-like domain-containing protein isoform X2 [Trachemys scripta elegans]